jgi:hypothetical protein
MKLTKLKYKNEILLFFIVVFGSIILYYGLGQIYKRASIIEGVTMGGAKNTNESIEIKQMKQKLKIMENDITNKVEPKLNKVIEKIKSTKAEVNVELKKESDDKINSFSEGNKKNKSVSKQDRVPPFSSSEISNVI